MNEISPGFGDVDVDAPVSVTVDTKVFFVLETPLKVAQGNVSHVSGERVSGDTVTFHGPPPEGYERGGMRTIELVMNGQAVASKTVPADGEIHDLSFNVAIDKSSWVALPHFPQLYTTAVNVIVGGKPIRASSKSALWCIETINQLWRNG